MRQPSKTASTFRTPTNGSLWKRRTSIGSVFKHFYIFSGCRWSPENTPISDPPPPYYWTIILSLSLATSQQLFLQLFSHQHSHKGILRSNELRQQHIALFRGNWRSLKVHSLPELYGLQRHAKRQRKARHFNSITHSLTLVGALPRLVLSVIG